MTIIIDNPFPAKYSPMLTLLFYKMFSYTYLKMKRIAVIDGQGGGIGSLLVKAIREAFGDTVEVTALGTNSTATYAMMKARANKGATGENAIVWNASRADYIIGPISIILANGMLGELTPTMATAIASSPAKKLLIPLNQEGAEIIGMDKEPLPHLIEHLISRLKEDIHV
jgi:hypothetical protein